MKHKQKSARATTGAHAESPALLPALARGLLASILSGLLLCLAASLAAYFTPDPASLARPLGLAASFLTALTGGYCTAKIHRREALLCGLLTGGAMLCVMLLLSLALSSLSSGHSVGLSVGLHLAFPLLSTVGAFLGIRKKPTASKRRRRNS